MCWSVFSGTVLNTGSKVVFAAYGDKVRDLCTEAPTPLKELQGFVNAQVALPGIVVLQAGAFADYAAAATEMEALNAQLCNKTEELKNVAMIVVADDAAFTAETLNNYLWVTYTRCNPSHDIYGIGSFYEHKHWGCKGPLVMDARIKPHHAPPLIKDEAVERRIDRIFKKGGSLYGRI
jgi:4-hydroxy-3-polyprenylbenzoate decarboxylase